MSKYLSKEKVQNWLKGLSFWRDAKEMPGMIMEGCFDPDGDDVEWATAAIAQRSRDEWKKKAEGLERRLKGETMAYNGLKGKHNCLQAERDELKERVSGLANENMQLQSCNDAQAEMIKKLRAEPATECEASGFEIERLYGELTQSRRDCAEWKACNDAQAEIIRMLETDREGWKGTAEFAEGEWTEMKESRDLLAGVVKEYQAERNEHLAQLEGASEYIKGLEENRKLYRDLVQKLTAKLGEWQTAYSELEQRLDVAAAVRGEWQAEIDKLSHNLAFAEVLSDMSDAGYRTKVATLENRLNAVLIEFSAFMGHKDIQRLERRINRLL